MALSVSYIKIYNESSSSICQCIIYAYARLLDVTFLHKQCFQHSF